jgi:methylmalonyl-CoA mutase
MEIAKFRAMRALYANLMKAWGAEDEKALNPFIHAETSARNQTIYDHYVNLLRGTTEGMSAVLGGVNSLSILPFDHAFRHSSAFSERIARNTQIILKEEAYLDRVADPAAGSWYIEKLTESVAEHSWKLFLELDAGGGFIRSLKAAKIQEMLKASASRRENAVSTRREILLGTNQYPDFNEQSPSDTMRSIAFPDAPVNKEIAEVEPLSIQRSAAVFEHIRLKTEKASKRPLVFLLTLGNPVWRKARAGFSSGFFACAGFEIKDNAGFPDIAKGMEEAAAANAEIVVLCSSDEEYSSIVPEALKQKKPGQILVVAGYPKDTVDALREMGIEHFIHMKSNVAEELRKYQSLLGIVN